MQTLRLCQDLVSQMSGGLLLTAIQDSQSLRTDALVDGHVNESQPLGLWGKVCLSPAHPGAPESFQNITKLSKGSLGPENSETWCPQFLQRESLLMS